MDVLGGFPAPPAEGRESGSAWHRSRVRARALARDPASPVLAMMRGPLEHASLARLRELASLLPPARVSAVIAAELEAIAAADAEANRPRGAMGRVSGAVGWLGARLSAAVGSNAAKPAASASLPSASGKLAGVLREMGSDTDTALDMGEALSVGGRLGVSYSAVQPPEPGPWDVRASRYCVVLAPRSAVSDAVREAVLGEAGPATGAVGPIAPGGRAASARHIGQRATPAAGAPPSPPTAVEPARRRATVDAGPRAAATLAASAMIGSPPPSSGAASGGGSSGRARSASMLGPRLAGAAPEPGAPASAEPLWGRQLPPCPLFEPLSHTVRVTNLGRARVSLAVRVTPLDPASAGSVDVAPRKLTLRPGEGADVTVTVRLTRPGVESSLVVVLEDAADAGSDAPARPRIPVVFRARSDAPLVGSPLPVVPSASSSARGLTFTVPRPLAACWARLAASAGEKFLFRLSSLPEDLRTALAALSAGAVTLDAGAGPDAAVTGSESLGPDPRDRDEDDEGSGGGGVAAGGEGGGGSSGLPAAAACPDGEAWVSPPLAADTPLHAAASALKAVLRRMPSRVLDPAPFAAVAAATVAGGVSGDGADAHAALLKCLPLGHARLLGWLVAVMAEVASHEDGGGGMGPEALGIVLGPNLRTPPTEEDAAVAAAERAGDAAAMVAASRALAEARVCGAVVQSMVARLLAEPAGEAPAWLAGALG